VNAITETGKAVGGFFDIMRTQPLALALVVMNFALLAYIFWTGGNTLEQVYKANAHLASSFCASARRPGLGASQDIDGRHQMKTVTEEAGKVANSLIDGLKQSPATLSLTLVLLGLLVWMFYALHAATEFRTTLLTQQNEYQKHVTEILSKCVVPRGD
jgi:predicted PurR-regulated permease PerM